MPRESTVQPVKLRRPLSKRMRAVVAALNYGATIHATGGRHWLDIGFEAGVPAATWAGLLERGLLRPLHRRKHRWGLSERGSRWAAQEWGKL
jgi:hypothetical protein